MSNIPDEAVMQRLYDEAYEELRTKYCDSADVIFPSIHSAAIDLAKKRYEFDYA